MVRKYSLYKNLRDIVIYGIFGLLEAKVPVFFPARRVFRHAGMDVTLDRL